MLEPSLTLFEKLSGIFYGLADQGFVAVCLAAGTLVLELRLCLFGCFCIIMILVVLSCISSFLLVLTRHPVRYKTKMQRSTKHFREQNKKTNSYGLCLLKKYGLVCLVCMLKCTETGVL